MCGNCGHEYRIKEGIANFLLPNHLGGFSVPFLSLVGSLVFFLLKGGFMALGFGSRIREMVDWKKADFFSVKREHGA